MRKIRDSDRARRLARRQGRRRLEASTRWKDYARRRNQFRSRTFLLDQPQQRSSVRRRRDYNLVNGPGLFSLRRNPEGVAKFIKALRGHFDRRKAVFVNLRDVVEIDYDALTVLLSVLIRFKAMRIRFTGSYPADERAKRELVKSDFFNHLQNRKFRHQASYAVESGTSIFTNAKYVVDSALSDAVVRVASKTVWGEQRRCPGVQRALVELMQNTHNHATPGKEGDRHWWLSVKHLSAKNRVAFSFLDYGVGVFGSLRAASHRFREVIDRVRHGHDADLLRMILEGKLHRTSSGKYFRGKGLRGLYLAMRSRSFSDFVMISNSVYYDGSTDEYRLLKEPFQGTFLYWELEPTNGSKPF